MRVDISPDGKVKLTRFDKLTIKLQFFLFKMCFPFQRFKWRPYDPTWLVLLAQQQFPNEKWLHDSLQECRQASGNIPYIHFVSSRGANKPGSVWQFDTNIILEDPEKGDLVLDILKDGRVGGVEFLGVLLKDG